MMATRALESSEFVVGERASRFRSEGGDLFRGGKVLRFPGRPFAHDGVRAGKERAGEMEERECKSAEVISSRRATNATGGDELAFYRPRSKSSPSPSPEHIFRGEHLIGGRAADSLPRQSRIVCRGLRRYVHAPGTSRLYGPFAGEFSLLSAVGAGCFRGLERAAVALI